MSRQRNKKIKIRCIELGFTNRHIAKATGINETTISCIINGVLNPSDRQEEAIANILGRTAEELF